MRLCPSRSLPPFDTFAYVNVKYVFLCWLLSHTYSPAFPRPCHSATPAEPLYTLLNKLFAVAFVFLVSATVAPKKFYAHTHRENFRCFLNFTNAPHSNLLNNSNNRAKLQAASGNNNKPQSVLEMAERDCSTLGIPRIARVERNASGNIFQ